MTIKIPKKRMLFVCSSLTIVLLSLIFYIVVMAVGFGLPGMATTGNIGFWHQTWDKTSSINGSGICCIVFAVLITALLVVDYFLVKKHNIYISKYLKRGALSIYVLFILALVLALVGKPTPEGITPWVNQTKYTAAGFVIVIFLVVLLIVPCTYAILTIIKYRKNKKHQKSAVQKEHQAHPVKTAK